MSAFQDRLRSWGLRPQAVQGDSGPRFEGEIRRPESSSNGLGLESPATKAILAKILIGFLGAGQLFAQTEQTEDIRPPKPLIEIPKPVQPDYTLWILLVGVLVLAILGWFLWKHFRKKSKPRTSSEIALADLSALVDRQDLPAAEFAERAALSVRRYIAGAFGIAAPNRTTEEFFRELPASSVRDDDGHLHSFLKSCDLAKFAAADLDAARRSKLIDSAKGFVISTSKEGGTA